MTNDADLLTNMNERKTTSTELALFIFPMVAIAAVVFGFWFCQWLNVIWPIAR